MKAGVLSTRQQATFLSIVSNYAEATELSAQSQENVGFAIEQNEKFLASLQGRVNIFKTTLQELARDVLNSNMFKGFIDSGTEVLRFLIALEDSIGILNSLLLLSLPKAISATSSAITKMIASGTALITATGGITIAIGAVIAVFAGLAKKHDDFIRDTKEVNNEIENNINQWDKLTEAQKENLRIESELNIQKMAGEYRKAKENIDEVTASIEQIREIIKPGSGKQFTTRLLDELEELVETQSEYNLVIETYERSQNIANGSLIKYLDSIKLLNQRTEEGADLQAYWNERINGANEAVEHATSNFDTILEKIGELTKEYEFLSLNKQQEAQAYIKSEIKKTEALLQEARKRANIYVQELQAQQMIVGFFDDAPMDTQLSGMIDTIDEYIFQVNKLESELETLIPSTDKVSSSTDKATSSIEKEATAIELLEAELSKLQAQEDYVETLDEKNSLRNQQISVLEKLQAEVGKNTLEWFQYGNQIKSIQDEMESGLNEAIQESIDLLEEQNDKLSEQADKLNNEVKDALQAEIDVIEAKKVGLENELDLLEAKRKEEEDEVKRQKILLDLQNARLKLSNIQAEQNTRVFRADQGFVFEADPRAVKSQAEEIAKLEENLRDHDVEQAKNAEEQKLKDKISALDREKNAVKSTMEKISDITENELLKQNLAWSNWLTENSAVLDSFNNSIDKTVAKIAQLNIDQFRNQKAIDTQSTQASGSSNAQEGLPSNIVRVRRKSDGLVSTIHRNTLNDPNIGHLFEELNTGGTTLSDGMAMLHKNEVVLNPAQVSRAIGGLGMQMGSAMQNAQNLFSFANQPKIAMAGQGGGSGNTIIENLSVSLPSVENASQFASEIQNIKRYFNNRSR